jgi:predicted transcriptional regulator
MDAERRVALLARYRAGPEEIAAALAEVGDDGLDTRPPDGGWTPREVVHHTADSEMTAGIRLRRLIAEDDPLIVGYDGDEFARRLHYDERPIEPALAAIAAARETTIQILEGLSEAEWGRTGTHSESGPYGVERWLEIYANHCHEHADQIRNVRQETQAEPRS